MFLVVACLLQNFTLSPIPGVEPPDVMKQVAGVNVSLQDYWIHVQPRT